MKRNLEKKVNNKKGKRRCIYNRLLWNHTQIHERYIKGQEEKRWYSNFVKFDMTVPSVILRNVLLLGSLVSRQGEGNALKNTVEHTYKGEKKQWKCVKKTQLKICITM